MAALAISPPAGHLARNVRLDIGDGDSNKINYFTPRIEGFQLALSYLPSFEECAASGTTNTGCNSSVASTSETRVTRAVVWTLSGMRRLTMAQADSRP